MLDDFKLISVWVKDVHLHVYCLSGDRVNQQDDQHERCPQEDNVRID